MMPEPRRTALGALIAIVFSLLAFAPSAAGHGPGENLRTVEPPPTTSAPSRPETTQPDTTEPAPSGSSDDTDATDVTTGTIVALLAFALLLVLAGWWMVSHNDDDGAPHPRPPGVDEPLPGQDLF